MLLHFKKSNEILETWSPHCKNLAFKDPPSLNFHNRTDAIVQLLQECRAFLKTSLDHDNYILYCCPNGEAGCLCPCSTTIDKKCPYCWFLRLELEGIIERWQICNANPSKWREIEKGIDCFISDSNESDSDQGNLLRGIVIWLVSARSVVQSTVSLEVSPSAAQIEVPLCQSFV